MVKEFALKNGAFRAELCDHWAKGGLGALDLADAVIDACENSSKFDYLYPLGLSIQDKIKVIATEMYGAGQVEYTDEVLEKIKIFTSKVGIMSLFVAGSLVKEKVINRCCVVKILFTRSLFFRNKSVLQMNLGATARTILFILEQTSRIINLVSDIAFGHKILNMFSNSFLK